MSIIEKMAKIVNDGDVSAGEQMIHDDLSVFNALIWK